MVWGMHPAPGVAAGFRKGLVGEAQVWRLVASELWAQWSELLGVWARASRMPGLRAAAWFLGTVERRAQFQSLRGGPLGSGESRKS